MSDSTSGSQQPIERAEVGAPVEEASSAALLREFERIWRPELQPSIREFVKRVPAGERDALAQQLAALNLRLRAAAHEARLSKFKVSATASLAAASRT